MTSGTFLWAAILIATKQEVDRTGEGKGKLQEKETDYGYLANEHSVIVEKRFAVKLVRALMFDWCHLFVAYLGWIFLASNILAHCHRAEMSCPLISLYENKSELLQLYM